MNVQLNQLNEEQRLWYGYLIASATKADGEVNPSEIEFLINALHFLNPQQKAKVQGHLKSDSEIPGLEKIPAGIDKRQLANVYTDLIWVIVSDGKLTKTEKRFLKKTADWFGFSEDYLQKLLQWGEQMLRAEKYRREVIAAVD
ncbi:MAG: TerB family tellurite resistance protein [Proteobacteria bacterium]|nr:TerB family tellurite resistance protein [Pseudomonadota bacterium]